MYFCITGSKCCLLMCMHTTNLLVMLFSFSGCKNRLRNAINRVNLYSSYGNKLRLRDVSFSFEVVNCQILACAKIFATYFNVCNIT